MRRLCVLLVLGVLCMTQAQGQGVIGDVLSGDLVKPKVGQWAWYDLTNAATGGRYVIRQAIVGSENVGNKKGYWLETEVTPPVGYKTLFKMLITGPASDPRNVHRIWQKRGNSPAEVVFIEQEPDGAAADREPERRSLGTEEVATGKGPVKAEHFVIGSGLDTSEVWLNDDVRPMGIVRMVSAQGELLLRDFGEGGEHARSAFDAESEPATPPNAPAPKVEVEVMNEEAAEGPETAEAPNMEREE